MHKLPIDFLRKLTQIILEKTWKDRQSRAAPQAESKTQGTF